MRQIVPLNDGREFTIYHVNSDFVWSNEITVVLTIFVKASSYDDVTVINVSMNHPEKGHVVLGEKWFLFLHEDAADAINAAIEDVAQLIMEKSK